MCKEVQTDDALYDKLIAKVTEILSPQQTSSKENEYTRESAIAKEKSRIKKFLATVDALQEYIEEKLLPLPEPVAEPTFPKKEECCKQRLAYIRALESITSQRNGLEDALSSFKRSNKNNAARLHLIHFDERATAQQCLTRIANNLIISNLFKRHVSYAGNREQGRILFRRIRELFSSKFPPEPSTKE